MDIDAARRIEKGDIVYTKLGREPAKVIHIEKIKEKGRREYYRFTVLFSDGCVGKYSHPWLLT